MQLSVYSYGLHLYGSFLNLSGSTNLGFSVLPEDTCGPKCPWARHQPCNYIKVSDNSAGLNTAPCLS